jgi:hypothetical protein
VGRVQKRHKRDLQRLRTVIPLQPCYKGNTCPNKCCLVSITARQTVRDEYMRIRFGIANGARYRAGCFAFSFIKREYVYPANVARVVGHRDSFENRQKCSHCKFDARELWNPAASHTYTSCGRKNEPKNGRCSRTEYMLWDGDVKVPVYVTFWKETFGLGLRAIRTLLKSANSYKLAEYRSKGQKKRKKSHYAANILPVYPVIIVTFPLAAPMNMWTVLVLHSIGGEVLSSLKQMTHHHLVF